MESVSPEDKRMKIKLIEPKFRGEWSEQDRRDMKAFWFARLTLPTVAALTPPDVDVSITDENVTEINYDEPVDLVGLTAMTMHAPAAYAIARRFRARGVPVVMGGIHASLMPHEAKQHVDSVVIGEAEEIWPQVVEDARRGQLKPFYRTLRYPDLAGLPRPRIDLLNTDAYDKVACVQTTRGCPFRCDYCSVSHFFGKTYRTRPVDDVIDEIVSLGERFIAFVDDNIIGDPRYARRLFERLIPLNIKWGSQASITIANDRKLLDLAAKSGCYSLFVGIESLDQENLLDVHKSVNKVEKYEEALKIIWDRGITLIGSFILGLDHDDEGVFERTLRFCERNRIELPVFFILTPLPGTPLFSKMEREGRIISRDWSKYDGMHVVFKPKLMSPETLQQGFQWLSQQAYSWSSILKRVVLHPKWRVLPHMGLNIAFRRIAHRIPKGQLGPLAGLLNRLNDAVSIKEVKNLLPALPEEIMQKGKEWIRDTYEILRIRAVYDETISTIFLKLEGALDLASANALMKKVQVALSSGKRIVIDFERVHHFTPRAVSLLFQENLERFQAWKDRVSLVNLSESVQGMLGNIRELLESAQILQKGALTKIGKI
jgi:radical SAM superfamily enzyme YgiQ (UPF0313 family)/anti-anti-sigma regulatory factor